MGLGTREAFGRLGGLGPGDWTLNLTFKATASWAVKTKGGEVVITTQLLLLGVTGNQPESARLHQHSLDHKAK